MYPKEARDMRRDISALIEKYRHSPVWLLRMMILETRELLTIKRTAK